MVDSVAVRVWVAARSLAAAVDDSALSAQERGRRAGLCRPEDRDRFVLGALLVRALGARVMRLPPDLVAVDRTCPRCGGPHGAPRILGCDRVVSVAHSGELVVLAAAATPVGVDVEAVRALDHEALLADVLAPGEPAPGDTAGFLAVWTAKEAYLKALGQGLAVPMPSVVLDEEGSRARMAPPRLAPPARLTRLAVPAGHVAAVAVLGEGVPEVDSRDAAELLR